MFLTPSNCTLILPDVAIDATVPQPNSSWRTVPPSLSRLSIPPINHNAATALSMSASWQTAPQVYFIYWTRLYVRHEKQSHAAMVLWTCTQCGLRITSIYILIHKRTVFDGNCVNLWLITIISARPSPQMNVEKIRHTLIYLLFQRYLANNVMKMSSSADISVREHRQQTNTLTTYFYCMFHGLLLAAFTASWFGKSPDLTCTQATFSRTKYDKKG